MSTLKKNDKLKIFIILAVITITIIISLSKNDKHVNLIGNNVTNGFDYTTDLISKSFKSLLIDNYTKEDIFDFAINNGLNIRGDYNRRLLIEETDNGNSFKIVNEDPYQELTYKKFFRTLNINSNEKEKIDSLLEYYKPEVLENIAYNRDDLVVSTRIYGLNKKIKKDILSLLNVLKRKDLDNESFDEADNIIVFKKDSVLTLTGRLKVDSSDNENKYKVKIEKNVKGTTNNFAMSIKIDSNILSANIKSSKKSIYNKDIDKVLELIRMKIDGKGIDFNNKTDLAKNIIKVGKLKEIFSGRKKSKGFDWEGFGIKIKVNTDSSKTINWDEN